MPQRKRTWTADWNAEKRVKVESGVVRVYLKLRTGNPWRSVAAEFPPQQFEAMTKAGQQAIEQDRAEQVQSEAGKRASALIFEGWKKDGRIRELERRNKELEGQLERVHDVVHPDRANGTVHLDPPALAPSSSDVAH